MKPKIKADIKADIKAHIEQVRAVVIPTIEAAGTRFSGRDRLLESFEKAVDSFTEKEQISGVIERVNEIVVAERIIRDPTLKNSAVEYEPTIIRGAPLFDFIITDPNLATHFIEVKTVHPAQRNSNPQRASTRLTHVPENILVAIADHGMGTEIFDSSFAARSSFLKYTLETEQKLLTHQAVRPGNAYLVFCGNGFSWQADELEDFADFYRTKKYRNDDPFSRMEAHDIESKNLKIEGNLRAMFAMHRKATEIQPFRWLKYR